jgi:hypothetical protein
MLVAVIKIHAANGFSMNWAGNQKGEGFEYHLLVLAIAAQVSSPEPEHFRSIGSSIAEIATVAFQKQRKRGLNPAIEMMASLCRAARKIRHCLSFQWVEHVNLNFHAHS